MEPLECSSEDLLLCRGSELLQGRKVHQHSSIPARLVQSSRAMARQTDSLLLPLPTLSCLLLPPGAAGPLQGSGALQGDPGKAQTDTESAGSWHQG